MEIFKDIPNYEGIYQVSNLGNVKSMERCVNHCGGSNSLLKERILKATENNGGYLIVCLCKNGNKKNRSIHQLVAEAFLNHKPDGHTLMPDHKNRIRSDNSVENLRIITTRENSDKKHIKRSSEYTGVCWDKQMNKWRAQIYIKGKQKNLGLFLTENEAHNAYQIDLKYINK